MTRAAAWSSCNRALDEWRESEWQPHRNRVEFIRSSSSVSTHAFSSALAASAHPHRIHTSRNPVKLIARSKSYAAKCRQKQIDHDNLLLIKKIIALDNAKSSTPRCGAKKKRPIRKPTKQHSNTTAQSNDKNTIVVPKPAHSNHECLNPLSDVPQTPASHILYTRASATMKNNFVEYNAPTMLHSSNSTSAVARIRSRAQSKILDENKRFLRRIISARATVDRSELERHEERHSKLRTTMSRHNSTSKLLQQQAPPRPLRTSHSQNNLRRDTGGDVEFTGTDTNSGDSVIRVDPISHLAQQTKQRHRSASQTSSKRVAPSCPIPLYTERRSVSSESLVSRIRNMTIENQCEDM